MDFYKLLAIISPFLSAGLTSFITYMVTMKGKRFDLLHQSKIPAFKELSASLIAYKNYCLGQVAIYQGNEFSPYDGDGGGTLHHRTEIARVASFNAIYFSKQTRDSIDELLNTMSGLCNAELYLAAGQEMGDLSESYFGMFERTDKCIDKLYRELNFKA